MEDAGGGGGRGGRGGGSSSYPTQWALNPSAYRDMDSSTVDWAALAQRWIQMKESAPPAPPAPHAPPGRGEAPMELEQEPESSPEPAPAPAPPPPPPALSPAAWSAGGSGGAGGAPWQQTGPAWNQWGWGWAGTTETKPEPAGPVPLMSFGATPESNMPSYTTATMPAPGYQTGYWTAPVETQTTQDVKSTRKSYETKGHSRNRRTRSDHRPSSNNAVTPLLIPSVEMQHAMPILDAAKRKQLPAWIREGLEKMEREKQRILEKQQEEQARAEAECLRKQLEQEEMERIKAEGGIVLPARSKFESDSEDDADKEVKVDRAGVNKEEGSGESSPEHAAERAEPKPEPLVLKTKEEILQEMMLRVRRTLTEILLEVTDNEIRMVSQEELLRYSLAQATRINAVGKSKALSAITSGLGLGMYESSDSESSDEDEVDGRRDVTDAQLQEMIRKRRLEFEKTSREIEAEIREEEAREAESDGEGREETLGRGDNDTQVEANNGEKTKHQSSSTPDTTRRERHSTTPPPVDRTADMHAGIKERRNSKDKPIKRQDSRKKLEIIHEEGKGKKSCRQHHTPSPKTKSDESNTPSKNSVSSRSSDSEEDSDTSIESSSKSTTSIEEKKSSKKRKRQSSSDSEILKTSSKKHRKDKKHSKNSHSDERYSKKRDCKDDYNKSHNTYKDLQGDKSSNISKRKDVEYYEKKRDYKYQRSDKYRDDSDDDRHHKRQKRSRSTSYSIKSDRRDRRSHSRDDSEDRYRSSKHRDRRTSDSYKRDRSYDRYSSRSGRDYERSKHRESERYYETRRSRSGSRGRGHRR